MKRSFLTLMGLLSVTLVLADGASKTQKTFQQDPINHPLFPMVMLVVFGVIVYVLVVAVLLYYAKVVKVFKASRSTTEHVVKTPKVVLKTKLQRA